MLRKVQSLSKTTQLQSHTVFYNTKCASSKVDSKPTAKEISKKEETPVVLRVPEVKPSYSLLISIQAAFQKDPQPLEAPKLISSCKSVLTAFKIYQTLIESGRVPTLGVFKSLLGVCLDLKQPERAKEIWNEMERFSIVPDYLCFGLLLRSCGKTGDFMLAKSLFSKVESNELKFQLNTIDCPN